ncbi:unnamed protein product [Blepharisma stoltei]|uniref:Oral cancer-overexpressed protein 1 n=1 Tax=Blepharisma stoltei TaxID=1481888 RepID=A0AAU9JVN6_9CILI|nr:unnamed protein product [Blepharisma stoltei]
MDFLDEVLSIEDKAFQEGYEIGKKIAEETNRKASHLEGFEIGKKIGWEIGYIKEYAMIIGENPPTERIRKLSESIQQFDITPDLDFEEFEMKLNTLRALYKNILSLLKVKPSLSTPSDIF